MSIVDDMFYELFEIADLYRSGLWLPCLHCLPHMLNSYIVSSKAALVALMMISSKVDLVQGLRNRRNWILPFPAPSVSYPSVRVSPLGFFAHRTSFPQFLGHVKLQKLQFCKVEELHLVPSVPAQEEVEAALSVFQILCCSARLAQG